MTVTGKRADRELEQTRSIWRSYLTGEGEADEGMQRAVRTIFSLLPSDPRCKICRAPFRGVGSVLARTIGFSAKAWQMNPTLCNRCETYVRKHGVGVEIQLTLLFADVRGSTEMAERLGPVAFHDVIDRFYRVASRILIDSDALLENLIGDEVAALYVPGIAGADYSKRAVEAAQRLLAETGHGPGREPWVEVGAGVHTGRAYVGAVGTDQTVGAVTVLGEAANTAARLASAARAGEVLVSEATREQARLDLSGSEARTLELKGVGAPVAVRVLGAATRE